MVSSTDARLAWRLQVQEYIRAACESLKGKSRRQIKLITAGDGTSYVVRHVLGDRNCFFHAVNRPNLLNRVTLTTSLIQSVKDRSVRKGFAFEIRQFLYIGLIAGHQDDREQEAYNKIVTSKFRNLVATLDQSEQQLTQCIQNIRESKQGTDGKTPQELFSLFKRDDSDVAKKFCEAYQTVTRLNNRITKHCCSRSVFENYVRYYLQEAEGFIPFSRRLNGEEFETPIDVINRLFHINIQILLNDGTLVTQRGEGPPISIMHNGIDHFDGLDPSPSPVQAPLQVNDIAEQLPRRLKPATYIMDHLLQVGYAGTVYQLLVLLEQVTRLMLSNDQTFRVRMEAQGYGNLDDIIILNKDSIGNDVVRAFQVKHYEESISADQFLNKSENPKKQAKMHIGKFLVGWLTFIKKGYNNPESIVYSNANLDNILGQCIQDGRFSNDFITMKKKVVLGGRKLKGKDFHNVLFEQGKKYLPREEGIALTPVLFMDFLRSFRFFLNRENLEQHVQTIIRNLGQLAKARYGEIQIDQLFLNLYNAVHEWFVHNRTSRTPPELTYRVISSLLEKAQVHLHDAVKLQGVTEANLARVSDEAGGVSVKRSETVELERALETVGLILVIGDKGIGKSALIKKLLRSRYEPRNYLFTSTEDLINNRNLKNMVLKASKQEIEIRIVVLDAAEALLSLPREQVQSFIDDFLQTGRRVILTITPEAVQRLNIRTDRPAARVELQPLGEEAVLESYPNLRMYESIEPFTKLICIPFYLNIVLKIVNQLDQKQLQNIVKKNASLEAELIEIVVCGPHTESKKARKEAWMALTSKLSMLERFENSGRLESLRDDTIVIDTQLGPRFSHDLFFEYGLIAFWTKLKKFYELEGKELGFWIELSKYLKFANPIAVLAKWFAIGGENLRKEILANAKALSREEVSKSLIALAIIVKDRELLNGLLKYRTTAAALYSADSDIMLSIILDSPDALTALLNVNKSVKTISATSSEDASETSSSKSHSETSSEEEQKSSSSETSSKSSSEDRYDPSSPSNSSDSDFHKEQVQYESEEESPIIQFRQDAMKYWCAGFNREAGWTDDEGEWIENPDYQERPDNSKLPVHQAVLLNRLDCLKILIEHKKHFNWANNCQETPLHLAVLENSLTAVQQLVGIENLVERSDEWGETPLHNVAYTGNIELARILLEHNASPNTLSEHGLTPLQIALTRLDLEMVKLFLEHEGDLSIHPFESEDITIADLLDYRDEVLDNQIDNFVIALIEYLDFGHSDFDRTPLEREIVEDLMTLIEHRAQLSEYFPGFDYYDSDTEIDYTIDGDNTKIDEITHAILDDPERIDRVLSSDSFSQLKEELVGGWLEVADERQLANIRTYIEEYDDEEVQDLLNDWLGEAE